MLLTACGRDPLTILGTAKQTTLPNTLSNPNLVNVRDSGAVGDGATDDTAAFARAIATLALTGGTIFVPAGVYLIDPVQAVRLTDNLTLSLAPDAVLQAIPVTSANTGIIWVRNAKNVRVEGGTIVGERNGHLGTTGEWGMGIRCEGSSDMTIDGVNVRDCWGDGIYVGNSAANRESQRVTITNCTVRNNRRQGLSMVGCIGGLIADSEFTDTNGTGPEAGIDLEPNPGYRVTGVTIRNCVAARNKSYGILLAGAVTGDSGVSENRILSSRFTDNVLDGAALIRGVTLCHFEGNNFARNGNNGIQVIASCQNDIVSNTFQTNGCDNPADYASVRLVDGSSNNTVSGNSYLPVGAMATVTLATPDCLNNVVG